jgi:hypothetical protein
MKKSVLFLEVLVLATLISMSMTCQVHAWMVSRNWINPVFEGYDSFLGATVVAYEESTTATLAVNVQNHYTDDANVTVTVQMDWETGNWSSKIEIPKGLSYVFKVDISIPSTATASNLVTHSYTLTVQYNRTGTVTTEGPYSYSNFAVYSSDQADARLLREKVETWINAYTPPTLYMPSDARKLWLEANVEKAVADDAYDTYGNFADAKSHYGNASALIEEALSSEVGTTSSFEDALLDLIDSAGSYLSMQGWAFIVIGVGFSIGFLLMGIGVVIYLVRRSKTPTKA